MTWGVDEVIRMPLPWDSHILGLDGDATFAFKVHGIQILGSHVTRLDRTCQFEDAVREGRLAMVNMGNDRKIADFREVHGQYEAYLWAVGVGGVRR